jgi:hypothetical protein
MRRACAERNPSALLVDLWDDVVVSSQTNRRDHYLPQGYLRGFIDPTRLSQQRPLWHFDVLNTVWSERSPREVGYRFGFYDYAKSVIGQESADSAFKQLENAFPLVRQGLTSTRFAGWKDHLDFLLQYMQMMRARSLLFFKQQHAEGENLRVLIIEEIAPDRKSVKVRSMTPEPISNDQIKNRALTEMLAEIQKGAAWLNDFHWALRFCHSPANPFLICENPLLFRGTHATSAEAFMDPEALLFFPLCWQACLIGSRKVFDIETDRFADADMYEIQKMYRASASLFLLSPQKLDYI